MTQRTIRVLCVDDHAFLIEGLKARFALERDLDFVGQLPSADQLVDEATRLAPDIVLLDVDMPGKDAFEAIEDLVATVGERSRVLMLSAHIRDRYIDAAADAGAWGYLSKSDQPADIVNAIRRAHAGEFVLGPAVLARAELNKRPPTPSTTKGRATTDRKNPPSRLSTLTPRERQVLRLIGQGLTRAAIAEAMHRSPKTIDTHRMSIMEKLDIHDRGELVRYAIREGLAEV